MRRRRLAAGLAAVALCGAAPACASPSSKGTHTQPPARERSRAPTNRELGIPDGVPLTADRSADPRQVRVIRAWAAALRKGHVREAARWFAQPSRAQNGTAVLTLDSLAARIAFNVALPCGALVVGTRGANGYTVVDFKLTKRPGGDCMGAEGKPARGALRVRRNRITDWFRLPDEPRGGRGAPSTATGPVV